MTESYPTLRHLSYVTTLTASYPASHAYNSLCMYNKTRKAPCHSPTLSSFSATWSLQNAYPPFSHHTRPGALISLLNSPISTILFLGVPFPAAILLALPLLCRICSRASSLLIPPGVAGAGLKGTSSFKGTVTVLV